MRILITGDMGYIGINLALYLKKKNQQIVGIDKKMKRSVETITEKQLNGIDFVVHLAAISGIKVCEENKTQAIENNICSSFRLFRLCSYLNIPLIFASSQAAKNPKNTYAFTKFLCEERIMEYVKENKINFKSFRFANVYGGLGYLEKKSTVVSNFIKDNEIIINGNGKQTRDFIHVEDICQAIWLGINNSDIVTKPIDIGTGVSISILELAEATKKKFTFNVKSDIIGTMSNIANIKKAKDILGFSANSKVLNYIKRHK
jgi:nucleoside-diphosphate-sugar epimerase